MERLENLRDTCGGTLDTGLQGGPRFPELEAPALSRFVATAADAAFITLTS